MFQEAVFAITVVFMALIALIFTYVTFNASKQAEPYSQIQEKSYSLRVKFFWVLAITGVIITVTTTLDLPYAATRGAIDEAAVTVNVEGRQWYWAIDDNTFKVGDTVVFNVTAADVNHGLGIYNEQMRMLGQTQAMPGYTNSLQLTFEKPGTYPLLCLEYCGLAHHAMVSEIVITE